MKIIKRNGIEGLFVAAAMSVVLFISQQALATCTSPAERSPHFEELA